MIFPTLYFNALLIKKMPRLEVYSKASISKAILLRSRTPKNAIIAGSPLHNSPITLSGRYLYLGYIGTLWSHGISFEKRNTINQSLVKLTDCRAKKLSKVCPDFILYSEEEKKYWNNQKIEGLNMKKFEFDFLYKVKENTKTNDN